MGNARRKAAKHIDWAEFRGNYSVVNRSEIKAILMGYRHGQIRKNELRVYAARLETRALHPKSKVDIYRIVNPQKSRRRRIPAGAVARSLETVDDVLRDVAAGKRKIVVSRKMLRFIARGGCSCTEAVVLLFYCYRRKKQDRRLERLREGERYARFTYAMLSEACGAHPSNISRAVSRLRIRGILATRFVNQESVNCYGQLFVDGPSVSLTPQHEVMDGDAGKATPSQDFAKTPAGFSSCPRKTDPKRRILERKEEARRATYSSEAWERFAQRYPKVRSFVMLAQDSLDAMSDAVA